MLRYCFQTKASASELASISHAAPDINQQRSNGIISDKNKIILFVYTAAGDKG